MGTEEKDFEAETNKLEKEAEERLEKKIEEIKFGMDSKFKLNSELAPMEKLISDLGRFVILIVIMEQPFGIVPR